LQYKFLICLVLSQLLRDSIPSRENSVPSLDLELLVFLKTKLCRRIAKLEVEKDRAPQQIRQAYETMFQLLEVHFLQQTKHAAEFVEKYWTTLRVLLPDASQSSHIMQPAQVATYMGSSLL